MAINPETQYVGKIKPASGDYPYGEARNITTPGDGTGTPWEAALLNDIFGFQQSLLSGASIVPSGTPDKVGVSQYLDALHFITSRTVIDKAALVLLDPEINRNVFVGGPDGGPFRAVTGAAPGTYSDDSISYCGTVDIPTAGDGSKAFLRVHNGLVSLEAFGPSTVSDNVNDCILAAINGGFLITEEQDRAISSKDMLVKTNSGSLENVLTILGDSISEGFKSVEYQQNSYVAHLRRKIQAEFQTKNYGYQNAKGGSDFGHVITSAGFVPVTDDTYYSGMYVELATTGNKHEYDYKGNELRVVYEIVAGGGTFTVTIDGVVEATIDTSVGTPSKGAFTALIQPLAANGWRARHIKIENTAGGAVRYCGIEYRNNSGITEPVLNNVSKSGATVGGMDNAIIDTYTDDTLGRSQVILALGVNDKLTSVPIATVRANVKRILDNVQAADGSALVLDFQFNGAATDQYKVVLREQALMHGYEYIDFAQEWYGNATDNVNAGLMDADGYHPANLGHREIARRVLTSLGIDGTLEEVPQYDEYNPVELLNTFTPLAGYGPVGYKIDKSGRVIIRGVVANGVLTPGTVIFTLPLSHAPGIKLQFITAAFGGTAFIEVLVNGDVTIQAGGHATYTSLNGIEFDAVDPWVNN